MTCKKCNNIAIIKSEPTRHCTSPNSINLMAKNEKDKYYELYCSQECRKADQDLNYALWAELDRNASDSECFVHERWENGARIGHCNITGNPVKVYPLYPAENVSTKRMYRTLCA